MVLDRDAELAAADLAGPRELLGDLPDHVAGDGETNTDVSTGRTDDRGIDLHQMTVDVNERPTGVAEIYRGIGLEKSS
jgi:hypothetical protein